jgi:hypothetical protein
MAANLAMITTPGPKPVRVYHNTPCKRQALSELVDDVPTVVGSYAVTSMPIVAVIVQCIKATKVAAKSLLTPFCGTGSAEIILATKLGVKKLVLIDKDPERFRKAC